MRNEAEAGKQMLKKVVSRIKEYVQNNRENQKKPLDATKAKYEDGKAREIQKSARIKLL